MAGAGYDVSNSRADSLSQGMSTATPTVFNFGANARVSGGEYDQDASPTANATAARTIGETQSAGAAILPPTVAGIPTAYLLIGAAAIVAIGALIYLHKHK